MCVCVRIDASLSFLIIKKYYVTRFIEYYNVLNFKLFFSIFVNKLF